MSALKTYITLFGDENTRSASSSVAEDGGQFPRQDARYYVAGDHTTVQGSWGVTDNNTGLTWQLVVPSTKKTFEQAKQSVATWNTGSGIGGYTDWRLPTARELWSIVDLGRRSPPVPLSFQFHPSIGGGTQQLTFTGSGAFYWTSDEAPDSLDQSSVYAVDMVRGAAMVLQNRNTPCYVRLVRGALSLASLSLSNSSTTVIDSSTNLMWKRDHETLTPGTFLTWPASGTPGSGDVFTWQAALKRGVTDTTGGYTDWRLPNIKELSSLIDRTTRSPAHISIPNGSGGTTTHRPLINPIFRAAPFQAHYWSSSICDDFAGNQNLAMSVSAEAGVVMGVTPRHFSYYARLVRDLTAPAPTSAPTSAPTEAPTAAPSPGRQPGTIPGVAGVNTAYNTIGWPNMNSIVQTYLNQASGEIASIRTDYPVAAAALNVLWAATGTQLNIEQRAIALCHQQVTVPLGSTPRDPKFATLPTTHYAFVDSLPQFAKNTKPHMAAQTLEAITNNSGAGGQSMVGKMRESRNQDRLAAAGIDLDNNIDSSLAAAEEVTLLTTGVLTPGVETSATLKQAITAIGVIAPVITATADEGAITTLTVVSPGAGLSAAATATITDSSSPSTQPVLIAVVEYGIVVDVLVVSPGSGFVNVPTLTFEPVLGAVSAEATAVLSNGGIGSVFITNTGSSYTSVPIITVTPVTGSGATATVVVSNGNVIDVVVVNPGENYIAPIVSVTLPTVPLVPLDDTTIRDNGEATEPGSWAGSPFQEVIPPNLNTQYTSRILLPATMTPQEAIDEIIRCNCDYWLE